MCACPLSFGRIHSVSDSLSLLMFALTEPAHSCWRYNVTCTVARFMHCLHNMVAVTPLLVSLCALPSITLLLMCMDVHHLLYISARSALLSTLDTLHNVVAFMLRAADCLRRLLCDALSRATHHVWSPYSVWPHPGGSTCALETRETLPNPAESWSPYSVWPHPGGSTCALETRETLANPAEPCRVGRPITFGRPHPWSPEDVDPPCALGSQETLANPAGTLCTFCRLSPCQQAGHARFAFPRIFSPQLLEGEPYDSPGCALARRSSSSVSGSAASGHGLMAAGPR